jgi:putative hemolysin
MRRGGAALLLAMFAAVAACSGPGDAEANPERASADQPAANGQPAPKRTDCLADGGEATIRPNEDAGPLCMRVGAKLGITSTVSDGPPWRPLVSADAAVLSCESKVDSAGAVNGVCTALAAGTTVVSTQTRTPASGASDHWRLTIAVM